MKECGRNCIKYLRNVTWGFLWVGTMEKLRNGRWEFLIRLSKCENVNIRYNKYVDMHE